MTPQTRKTIYTVSWVAFAALLFFGLVTPEHVSRFYDALVAAGAALALFTNLLASRNVNERP